MVGLLFLTLALILAMALIGLADRRQVLRVPLYIRRPQAMRRRRTIRVYTDLS